MLPRQDLAEGAPYEHDQHGRVRVVLVDETDQTVTYEQTAETHPNTPYQPMHIDSIDTFRAAVDPLPITVSVPTQTSILRGGLQ